MQTCRNLAVVDATQGSRILTSNPHRVRALLGETGVIDNERFEARKFALQLRADAPEQLGLLPLRHHDSLLKTLTHALYLMRIINEARSHWLDAPALAIQQQTGDIKPHRCAAFGTAHASNEAVDIVREFAVEFLELLRCHVDFRSRANLAVNK